jgi:putative DNA primase/helicase
METNRPNIDVSKIPVALKERNQWIAWKTQTLIKGEKPKKIPINPNTQGYAKADNPKTWASFETAINYLNSNGRNLTGIGYVVNYSDPYTGGDIDNCRNPQTGKIDPWAMEIIKNLNTYSEISPSGTGIRWFAEGRLNERGRKKGNIEAYFSHRFLTITGAHLEGTPTTIEKRQNELDSFYHKYFAKNEPKEKGIPKLNQAPSVSDQDLVEKIKQSRNGDKFQELMEGNFSNYPSQSEADLALCSILAFWTGNNPSQIDGIFRQSGLMRDKWDEKHGLGTYGEITINKAIEGTPEVYNPSTKNVVSITDRQLHPLKQTGSKDLTYSTLNLPSSLEISQLNVKVEWVVENLIPKEGITLLHSIGGVGKSYLMYQIAKKVANGEPFFNLPTMKMPVFYIDFENPLPEIVDRMKKIGGTENLKIWHLGIEPNPIRFDANEWEIYKTFPLGLFIIDSLRSSYLDEENSSKVASFIMGRHKEIRSLGNTIILIHHENKIGSYRGSTAWFDLSDHILKFSRVKEIGSDKDIDDDDFNLPIRLGLGGKSRFSSAMSLNPMFFKFENQILVCAENPDTEPLRMIHKRLIGISNNGDSPPTQGEFLEVIKKELALGKHKARQLLKKGEGLYWNSFVNKNEKNKTVYTPILEGE